MFISAAGLSPFCQPVGNLLANSIAPLPLGTIIILPGLVLAPIHAPLNAVQVNGILFIAHLLLNKNK
jgi:hypothetical protein